MNMDEMINRHVNKIKGCLITDLSLEKQGNNVLLKRINITAPNGDKFVILPFNWEQLHVEQILWGE